MRHLLLLAAATALSGCALNDFVQKQAAWNAAHGMGGMNGMPVAGMPSMAAPSAADDDAATQARIRQGEELENEEARKAGLGPSPTAGMNCTSTSSYAGSANSGVSTASTSCHN